MVDGQRFYSGSFAFHGSSRLAPGAAPPAIAVASGPEPDAETVGIAYQSAPLPTAPDPEDVVEARWRLVIGKQEAPGAWVLRLGEFVRVE